MAIRRSRPRRRPVANGSGAMMLAIEQLFDYFLHAAAVFAALEVLYVALIAVTIAVLLKALR